MMRTAGAAVAIPVAVYVLCVSVLHDRPEHRWRRLYGPAAALLVLLTPFTPQPALLTGLVLALLTTITMVSSVSPQHAGA